MKEILKVGIMSREQFQKRILDAAAERTTLNKDDPKIWFSSIRSLDQTLSDNSDRLSNRPNS